jgi:hypothetical protein
LRNGLKRGPFGSQYTDDERVLLDAVLKITKEVTGRHGDYNGEILVLAQEWTKSNNEVRKKVDIPVITKIPEVIPKKKPYVKRIVDTKLKQKRKRQKINQPVLLYTFLLSP